MKRTGAYVALLAVCLAVFCAGFACAQGVDAAVIDAGNSDRLHLRAQPSQNARSLGLYFTGTQVEVTGEAQGDFVPVRIGAEYGFMHADYLKTGEAAAEVIPKQPFGVATPKAGARLRRGPSVEADTLDVIAQGDAFTVLGETDSRWYYAQYEGQFGYVSAEASRLVDAKDALQSGLGLVLLGEEAFETSGGFWTIDELGQCLAIDGAVVPNDFAVLNLDEDALDEVVVRAAVNGDELGFLVLDVQTEQIYGYVFYLRALNELKQDGTFIFSSGAIDNGIGCLTFSGPVAQTQELARSQDNGHGEPVYAVNGSPASQQAYEEALRIQEAKPDADWHALTKENIDAWFAR